METSLRAEWATLYKQSLLTYTKMLQNRYCFLYCAKYVFFWLYQSIRFEVKYASEGASITSELRFPGKSITLQRIFYPTVALKRKTLKWARYM